MFLFISLFLLSDGNEKLKEGAEEGEEEEEEEEGRVWVGRLKENKEGAVDGVDPKLKVEEGMEEEEEEEEEEEGMEEGVEEEGRLKLNKEAGEGEGVVIEGVEEGMEEEGVEEMEEETEKGEGSAMGLGFTSEFVAVTVKGDEDVVDDVAGAGVDEADSEEGVDVEGASEGVDEGEGEGEGDGVGLEGSREEVKGLPPKLKLEEVKEKVGKREGEGEGEGAAAALVVALSFSSEGGRLNVKIGVEVGGGFEVFSLFNSEEFC